MRRTASSLTGPGPSAATAPSNGAWMPSRDPRRLRRTQRGAARRPACRRAGQPRRRSCAPARRARRAAPTAPPRPAAGPRGLRTRIPSATTRRRRGTARRSNARPARADRAPAVRPAPANPARRYSDQLRVGESDDSHGPGCTVDHRRRFEADVEVRAHNGKRQARYRLEQRVHAVIELVVPAAAAAIGRSAMSSQRGSPSSARAGLPTMRSPTSSHIAGPHSRSRSSSSTIPDSDPLSP